MVQFFVKRFIGLIFVVIAVTFITFIMGYFAPGDPITQLLGQHYTQQAHDALRHAYGLDLPWYTQYFNFIVGMLHLNFGMSFEYKDLAVWDILKEGVPISAELGFGPCYYRSALVFLWVLSRLSRPIPGLTPPT